MRLHPLKFFVREETIKGTSGMIKLGRRIACLRKERGLTMKQVAEKLGVPLTTYREWEYGRSIRNPHHFIHLLQFFGLSIEDITSESSSKLSIEDRLNRALSDIAFVQSELTKKVRN